MTDFDSLVPVVANAAISVSKNMTGFITNVRASGVVRRTELEMLIMQTEKVLADMRAYEYTDNVITNLEQIAKTQERIDALERQGLLHGDSLKMAMDQLSALNTALRNNLKKLENRRLR